MSVSLPDDNIMQLHYDNDNGDISKCIILIWRDIDRIQSLKNMGSQGTRFWQQITNQLLIVWQILYFGGVFKNLPSIYATNNHIYRNITWLCIKNKSHSVKIFVRQFCSGKECDIFWLWQNISSTDNWVCKRIN